MFETMHPTWKEWLKDELVSEKMKALEAMLAAKELQGRLVYPPKHQRLRVFEQDPATIRVIIVGQDPYHGKGKAIGLSFAVAEGVSVPPSLRNIYKELEADIPHSVGANEGGDLTPWTEEGVFLLNAILTVEAGSPASHQNCGWEEFTSAALRELSRRQKNLVFLLWGKYAHNKGDAIEGEHLVLRAAHPSPFAAHAGFFGSKPFSQANEYLLASGLQAIDWRLAKK